MAELREGWYVAYTAYGKLIALRRTSEGLWSGRSEWPDLVRPTLPDGWILGPRLDDLLRDAMAYCDLLIEHRDTSPMVCRRGKRRHQRLDSRRVR